MNREREREKITEFAFKICQKGFSDHAIVHTAQRAHTLDGIISNGK